MADNAISYGTTIWLSDLKRQGWNLTVTQHHAIVPHGTIRCTEDDFEPLELLAPVKRVGVIATLLEDGHEGAAVFVPVADEAEAWRLLERVEEELA